MTSPTAIILLPRPRGVALALFPYIAEGNLTKTTWDGVLAYLEGRGRRDLVRIYRELGEEDQALVRRKLARLALDPHRERRRERAACLWLFCQRPLAALLILGLWPGAVALGQLIGYALFGEVVKP